MRDVYSTKRTSKGMNSMMDAFEFDELGMRRPSVPRTSLDNVKGKELGVLNRRAGAIGAVWAGNWDDE